ncbi:hypothetical protein [Nocardia sp. NPDC050710]|uniref:hypothetical protein n=1 Tax=Nocardia sp. NPDC050710 TaxID=3157220 RepID=UPI0033C640E0
MSTQDERRREQAELEAEFQRLDIAHAVLADMLFAAADTAQAKGFGPDCGFEIDRLQRSGRASKQVHDERTALWDRLLDYRHTPQMAGRIRAKVAERSQRPGRSR